MGIVWSAKGSKDPPLVSADEFLILDSEDATLSTKNKRVTLATVQANLVTSVDANDFNITKLNSISINDSANDNTFTISSSVDLAADRTINLPLLTADDTFAMLGVSNRFLEDNTFEKNILLVSDVSCTSIFTTVAANNGLGGRLVGQFARGTITTPSAILDNDRLYVLLAAGFDGTIFTNAASLIWGADGNWTGSNHGSSLTFTTTPTNTTTPENNILIKNRVISFEDNDLDNIKSIKLNDASDDNKFTILGAELTIDRTATIPPLSVDDTFAMLGVNNTFTGENTWTDDLVQLEDNTSQNANFTGEVFSTSTVEKTGFQGFRAAGTKAIPAATTSGSVIVDLDAVGFDGTNFSIGGSAGFDTPATWSGTSTPVRFSIFTTNIDSTTNVENFVIDADGTADFKGNNITNAVIQSNLTDGSILVGNESNVSKDFPAKLQTKADCDVATTVSGDLATSFESGDIIDTVTLDVGDRILIKNQSTSTENGIYTVNSSGPPTRAADANEDSEVNNGMFTKIIEGNININTAFVLVTPDNITLGVTDLTFKKFSFSNIAQLNEVNTFTRDNTFFDTVFIRPDDFNDSLLDMGAFGNVPVQGPLLRGIRSRGSQSSPSPVLNNDILFELTVQGFDGTFFVDCGRFTYKAAGDFTRIPLNRPSKFEITTTPANSLPVSITRLIIGSEGETSFQDNTIQDIKSIKLNDSDDTHSYTILGGDLSTDLNVTIPDITVSDTFAMLNVQNEFTQRQIITLPISTVVDGLSVGNADGQLVLGNNTADVGEFAPLLSLTSKGSDNPSTIQALIAAADDTGTTPASVINVQRPGGFAITTRPLWEIQNNGVTQVSVAADGDWDFKGNAISDIGTLDYTDAIATIVTGVLTTTVTYQSVAGEGAAADDLVTITAGTTGQYLIIRPSNGAVTITVKNTGNIVTIAGNDFVMDDIEDTMTLIFDGTNWIEISRNTGTTNGKRQIFLYHSENTTLDSILLGAGNLSTTGNTTSFLDADGYYVRYVPGGMDAQPDITFPDVSRRNHNFDLTIKFRSPLSTERRLWFGFFTANPEGTNTPTTDHIGVRLSTDAGDTGFVLSHAGGATQAEESLAVSDTAVHTIRIVADAANNKFSFSFDGGALTDVTTNIPAATENLDFFITGTGFNATPVSQFDFWFMTGFADV